MARTILVTGASRGIGKAVAQRFATAGDRVVVHYCSNKVAAEDTVASLAASPLGPHKIAQADLLVPGSATKLLDDALALVDSVDVLVANHGLYEETPFDETSPEEWSTSFERILRINLHAPAEMAHGFAKHLVSRNAPGAIVFVGSRGALRGEPLAPAYGASKAGLHALSGSLAQALGPKGIRVATVAPGFIATDMAKPVLDGPRGDGIRSQSSWNRVGEVGEVAEAVYFLAGAGTWCTGAVLDCNGSSYLH